MAMPYRTCSECGKSLEGKPITAKTCGGSCRAKRSRRFARQKKEAGEAKAMPDHQREITERVRAEVPDVAHQVIEEEIRPVVRESITQDTLEAIGKMVALTPAAVKAISDDLASDDAVIRQRAYTLIMKYTVGHQAIVRPPEEEKGGNITVHFELPRPDDASTQDGEAVEVEATEVKTCDLCGEEKSADEFVANSDRCVGCYEAQQAKASELLADANADD